MGGYEAIVPSVLMTDKTFERQGTSLWWLEAAQVFLHILSWMGEWALAEWECCIDLFNKFGFGKIDFHRFILESFATWHRHHNALFIHLSWGGSLNSGLLVSWVEVFIPFFSPVLSKPLVCVKEVVHTYTKSKVIRQHILHLSIPGSISD